MATAYTHNPARAVASEDNDMRKQVVVVDVNGEIDSHMPDWSGNYATLCGLDGDDPHRSVRQSMPKVRATVITCTACFRIWQVAKKYSVTDFSPS